jgi:hypothetical protein
MADFFSASVNEISLDELDSLTVTDSHGRCSPIYNFAQGVASVGYEQLYLSPNPQLAQHFTFGQDLYFVFVP